MDDETEDIRRRIAEARGVQERLTQMQQRIRQQYEQLEHAIRGFAEPDGAAADELGERLRGSRSVRSH